MQEIHQVKEKNRVLDFSFLQPLKKSENRYSFPFPSLKSTLFFIGTNTRPDHQRASTYLVGTKNAETAYLQEKQKVYLRFSDGKVVFSKEKTPLFLEVLQGQEDLLQVQMSIFLEEEGEVILHESEKFTLKTRQNSQKPFPNEEAIFILENAKFWGKDQLLQKYGGGRILSFV